MRKKIFTTIILILAITFIQAMLLYFFIISGAVFSFRPNPPTPQIQYGEFPFQLTYELEGNVYVINDSIVCEFKGFKNYGSAGKYRIWKTSLKSGRDNLKLLDLSNKKQNNEFGHQIIELFFYYGNGEFYMDDNEDEKRCSQNLESINYTYQTNDGRLCKSAFSAEEAWNKYKIRLISWQCEPPIENNFSK